MRTLVILVLFSRAVLAGPITRTLCDDNVYVLTASPPDLRGRVALAAPWSRADWHVWLPVQVWSHAPAEPGTRYLAIVRAKGYALGETIRCSRPDDATVVARVSLAPLDRILDLVSGYAFVRA